MRRALAVALAATAVAGVTASAAPAAERERFDTRVHAIIPEPGYPAHAYVGPNKRVYEGTYDDPEGNDRPSRVLEYTRRGRLLRSWTVRGQDVDGETGVQVATMDARKRLILLDKNPGRVIRLDRRSRKQKTIARFPDGVVPNYAAWGPDDALYVTDYHGPSIYRIAAGEEPEVWTTSPLLDGMDFGATSINLESDGRSFLVGVMSGAGLGAGDPTRGRIVRFPIEGDGSAGEPEVVYESRPLDGLDGFAIARSGAIYVAMLLSNQIAVIEPDGTERERFPEQAGSGANGSEVPFDAPSSVRFLGRRLMIANQSFAAGNRDHWAVLDVYAGEKGLKERRPSKRRAKKR